MNDTGHPPPACWYPFEIRFTVPDPITSVSLNLGLYFTKGKTAFDHLRLVPADTDITLHITAEKDNPLRLVTVKNTKGTKKTIFTSGTLPPQTYTFDKVLPRQPTDARYLVTASCVDGQCWTQSYPAEKTRASTKK